MYIAPYLSTPVKKMNTNMTNPLYYDIHQPNAPRHKDIVAGVMYGYHFTIRSYGTHPCAYIEIPSGHPYEGLAYDDYGVENGVYIPCHGGLTYAGDLNDSGSWWFGWDYAHCNDLYYAPHSAYLQGGYHEYTVEEIISEIETAISFIIEDTKKRDDAKKKAEENENYLAGYIATLPKALRDLIDDVKRRNRDEYATLLEKLVKEV